MWTLHTQQQQRGAQLHTRKTREPGEPPAEATADRAAQEHDRAGGETLQPGDYPASPIENRDDGGARAAPEAQVAWDGVVQPERPRPRPRWDALPLPDGK